MSREPHDRYLSSSNLGGTMKDILYDKWPEEVPEYLWDRNIHSVFLFQLSFMAGK